MKRFSRILIVISALLAGLSASAQNVLNEKPESLIGNYYINHAQFKCKVKVSRENDGTFKGQIFFVENAIDSKTGKLLTDEKNPDKSLRNTPCDRIVLLYDLRYNERKQCWDRGTVYDPTCGIRANATLEFVPDGRLKVKGSLFGISEFVYWDKL